jgi:hypothetical protein
MPIIDMHLTFVMQPWQAFDQLFTVINFQLFGVHAYRDALANQPRR